MAATEAKTTQGTTTDSWLDLADAPLLDGLRFRRPRGDDAEYDALAELIGVASRQDAIPWFPSGSMLREEWEEDDKDVFDPPRDAVITEIDRRIVAVSGSYRVIRNGRPVYQVWGHVDPAWRRRGIGTALLAENLRRVEDRAARLGDPRPDGRPEVRSLVGDTEAGAEALLSAVGLVPIRWVFLMRRPTLDDIPEAPLPEGLEIRAVVPAQHRAIILADAEASRDHWDPRDPTESSIKAMFEREELATDLWVVAWYGGQVAGSVQSWIWRHENERLGVRRGWLESISVRRRWRRRGLGRALTAEALRRLKAAGMDDAMLGVDASNPTGALGLYQGLGFEVETRSQIFAWPSQQTDSTDRPPGDPVA
jgi:mycothiol synthase